MKDLTAGEYALRKIFSSDYEFTKKADYFTGNGSAVFALTTQVLTQDEWTPAVIEARQADLLAVLDMEWELN